MAEENALQKLAKLSQRERQVLGLVCAGMMYKEIARTLFISLPTVKAVMGRVYVKLELDQLDKAARTKAIYQIYGPLLKTSALPPEPMPPETDEPVPSGIIQKVDEDELAVIDVPPQEIIYIPTPPKSDRAGKNETGRPRIGLFITILLFICLLAGLYLFRGSIFPGLAAPKIITQIVTATGGTASENSIAVSPTLAQPLPTNTSIPQEATATAANPPQPTATLLPTPTVPAIALPFSDNFDSGAGSAWQVLNGNWLTADGRYTIADADNTWEFAVLNDPQWKNYQIKTNVRLESSDEGEIAIVVRYSSSASKYLAFHAVNIFSKAGWAYYDGNDFTNITGYGSIAIPRQFDLELDVAGSQFIAKINGMTTQEITLSGYDSGGIALGISCFYAPCAGFDNFQVNPAP